MAASQRQVPLLQQQQLQEQQLQMDAQQQQALQRVQQQHVQVTRRTGMAVCSGNKEDGDVWV
jgi:adenosylmethionine-8-amino-7-oxononanoate aminotransferase